ncbi:Uncharacterised protein [Vibrio cholerae]|nr:Uncharacterised protein [Vibrio cholerae]CSI68783.1 Uncharacterised protein [Vibrio cholerae]
MLSISARSISVWLTLCKRPKAFTSSPSLSSSIARWQLSARSPLLAKRFCSCSSSTNSSSPRANSLSSLIWYSKSCNCA